MTKLKCGHSFCLRCVKSHVKWNVLDPGEGGWWGYPKCPVYECWHPIRSKRYFTKNLLALVHKQIRLKSQLNEGIRHCSVIDCTGVIQKFGKDERCPVCRVVICQKCQTAKSTRRHVCSVNEKMSVSQQLRFSKCPRCHTIIQKDVGCDMVFCVVCEVNFDYEEEQIIKS